MGSNKGRLYLIPSPIGEMAPSECLPQPVTARLLSLDTFIVEELRSARRFLSAAGLKGRLGQIDLHVLNEHTPPEEAEAFLPLFEDGHDAGLLSEAGLPAVADPGASLVALCHRHGIGVTPLVGPSSLMLALMASGLNGQSFSFLGYLPAKTEERRTAVLRMERQSSAANQTQIFIETPYRNDALFAELLKLCRPATRICIAVNLTMPDAFICTRTAAEWRKSPASIGKRPCVFLLQS